MIHYTLNTANTFQCSSKNYDREALQLLRPLAQKAFLEGQAIAPLPQPFEAFSVKVTAAVGAALFDLFDVEKMILTTNAVAWTQTGQEQCWEGFENLYLKLMTHYELLTISRAPQRPSSLPWLATLVLPNPRTSSLPWLADFEQCLALALIQASQPKKHKPKGFGK